VEAERIRRASTRVADEAGVGGRDTDDSILNALVVEGVVARPDLGGDTGNVGGSHGGTRDGVGALRGADPSSGDASAGSEDLATGAEGREGRASIGGVSGHHGEGEVSRGGGGVAGVVVGVTSSDSHHEASAERSISGIVDTLVAATTERHVADNTATTTSNVGRPVDTSNDTSERARAVGAEDLDADEGAFLGKTVASATSSGGNVGAVSIAIEHTFIGSIEGHNARSAVAVLEVVVLAVDTSVNDVDLNARASGGRGEFVGGGGNWRAASNRADADGTGKTPRVRSGVGGAGLRSAGNHVGLDVLDIRVSGEGLGVSGGHLDGVALEVGADLVGVHGVGRVHHGVDGALVGLHRDVLLENDDELARDDLRASWGGRVIDGRHSDGEGSEGNEGKELKVHDDGVKES